MQWEGATGPVELFLGGKHPENSATVPGTAARRPAGTNDHAASSDIAAHVALPGDRTVVLSVGALTNSAVLQLEGASVPVEITADGQIRPVIDQGKR